MGDRAYDSDPHRMKLSCRGVGTLIARRGVPRCVTGDRAYDSDPHRMRLSGRGIGTLIARRGVPHGSGLGVFRYVVEQAVALLHQMRRLRTRFERRDDVHEALLKLGCIRTCHTRLTNSFF